MYKERNSDLLQKGLANMGKTRLVENPSIVPIAKDLIVYVPTFMHPTPKSPSELLP